MEAIVIATSTFKTAAAAITARMCLRYDMRDVSNDDRSVY